MHDSPAAQSSAPAQTSPPAQSSIRWWTGLATVAVMAAGMAYALWWPTAVRHHGGYWLIPGDIWATVRDAHFVGWGGLSYVYGANTGLVTLPGFSVVLAPFAMLSSALGLSESSPFIGLAKPDSWFVYGPVILATTGLALAAMDALARHLGATRARRLVLVGLGSLAMWSATAIWGHPEDLVALALAAYAVTRAAQGRTTAAGWLLGAAIAMQLYVVLLVPVLMGVVGRRRLAALVARASVLPAFLLVAVLAPNFRQSMRALWNQPNFPSVDHATPWVLVAPKIGPHVVAAGPGRIVAVVVAVALGFVAARHRHDGRTVVWLAAAALAGRCLFEAVMVPYYVMPMVVLALVVAATYGMPRLLVTGAIGIGLTVVVFGHFSMWPYWSAMAGLTVAMLGVSRPWRAVAPDVADSAGPERLGDLAGGVLDRGLQLLHAADGGRGD
ncbi:MAG TPA: hypothetical protein VMV14_04135 [Acidimicrobiales bacterium]|nr:hypothetical protein [Acidimicrobiales bacterium]